MFITNQQWEEINFQAHVLAHLNSPRIGAFIEHFLRNLKEVHSTVHWINTESSVFLQQWRSSAASRLRHVSCCWCTRSRYKLRSADATSAAVRSFGRKEGRKRTLAIESRSDSISLSVFVPSTFLNVVWARRRVLNWASFTFVTDITCNVANYFHSQFILNNKIARCQAGFILQKTYGAALWNLPVPIAQRRGDRYSQLLYGRGGCINPALDTAISVEI